MTAGITFRGVSHAYAERPVLRAVDLDLTESRIGIVGSNGSGKSTLARMINGLVLPDSGTVHVNGLDTKRKTRAVRKEVGFVFTDPDRQIIMPTVAEDVALSLSRGSLSKSERAERVGEVLARFGLGDHGDHPAQKLSGGQKQLLALASILVTEPSIIVADEPTTLLDLRNSAMIRGVFAELKQQLIVVSHDLELLSDFDRVLVIDDGGVVADGAPAETISRYRALMA